MARPQPKVGRILKNDYVALLLILAPVVSWGIYIAKSTALFSRPGRGEVEMAGQSPIFLAVVVVITLLCVTALVVRIRGVQGLFAKGTMVTGQVTSVYFMDDRGRVEFTYSVGGRRFNSGAALHKTAASAALSEGQQVEIIVDPARPEKALITSLYS